MRALSAVVAVIGAVLCAAAIFVFFVPVVVGAVAVSLYLLVRALLRDRRSPEPEDRRADFDAAA